MKTFLDQINEDIQEYQKKYNYISNIQKNAWAFNYWILDKLFHEDEELIESKIIDYQDMGIDCYEVYEDTHEIYLLQNKYYSDNTKLLLSYVEKDFLLRPLNALKQNIYTHNKELQTAFNALKNYDDFKVYLNIYVTNNRVNDNIKEVINKFNKQDSKYIAKIFYLDDIKDNYYNEPIANKTILSVNIESVNKGTILNIDQKAYKLPNVLNARYVMTPVPSIFRLYRKALEKGYPIFERNIREYLGKKGINKKIYDTLIDKDERKNFFYYNNGITIICDSMTPIEPLAKHNNISSVFTIENPQIVNGCQSVNSIYEALQNSNPKELEKEFADTFVMLKILVIDKSNQSEKELYKNIVTYNNSQNTIKEKMFVANQNEFKRLQDEFLSRGFLLIVKPSDKNKFKEKYSKNSKFSEYSKEILSHFGIKYSKFSDLFIDLEKLLQVINAFSKSGQIAYTKKSNMLKYESDEFIRAMKFIKSDNVCTNTILYLYLLYKKAETIKKESSNKRTPIPYYLIDAFAKYDCNERNERLIRKNLSKKENIENYIKIYSKTSKIYIRYYYKKYNIEYNAMIKQPIDYCILKESLNTTRTVLED